MSNESLSSYIDRLMQLEIERKENSEMIKELKTEAKSSGFDPEALAEVVRRKMWDEKKKAKAKEKDTAARLYAKEIGQLHLFDN